ncbi:copper chaperone PCu(A)C [Streptomyces sp. 8L]|uniref:copper chaperone PCu(A)C n=1 Tax=Streptomyces sp. 8L TaxID=2877242 RepID=UPI001CD1C11B|nr:copper chaperone PCu(A)C [Streptomyces sp. 8L]MCA1218574.1 copper chaperone PCu(A)C [Streptomyces sp. 8L]
MNTTPPAPGTPPAAKWRSRLADTVRAVAAPVLCCALALLALTAWSRSGLANRPSSVSVSRGTLYRPLLDARTTAAFFRIDNTGPTDDTLVSVTSTATGPAVPARTRTRHGAGTMRMGVTLPVPAHSSVRMNASEQDVMVELRHPLRLGERVPFVLHFRYAGDVEAVAEVTAFGGPRPPVRPNAPAHDADG